jgi:penicillin-binding protein 1A
VRQQLDDQFGRQLYEQGLKVYTTLDPELQSAAERALETQLRAIEAGRYGAYKHISYEKYTAQASDNDQENNTPNSPYLQGAFVAMDPRDGSIRALIGGRNFDDSKFNRAVQALRQPGSTFKPIVYADAIQNGRPPSYIVDDAPLSYTPQGGQTWEPQNYDSKFEGKMPLRRALYESRNLATIRLGMELGESSVIDEARKFGLTTPIPPYPSIHIGAASVYPIELIAAYSAFATLGTRATPIAITRVENQKGDVLWAPTPQRSAVLSPEEAWLMVDMMKDVIRKGTAAGTVGSVFHLPAGGKTGTTNDGTDVWFIGYTSDLVAGVWMGLDKPQKIKANAQGGVLAAPAWAAFMNQVYKRKPAPPDWPRPSGIIARTIDQTTNTLWTDGCAGVETTEYFIPGTEPTQTCAIAIAPDTSAFGTPLPPDTGARPGAPPGTQPSNPFAGAVVPGAVPMPRPTRASRDTAHPAPRDSLVFPRARPRDTTRVPRPGTPPR